ncbi:10992_t:CDS:2, partial [Ambispora gerdemannii]
WTSFNKKEIEEQLDEVRAKLDKLPDPITGNPQFELNRMIGNCASAIEKETKGEKRNLWRDVNKEFERFKIELCSTRPIFVVGKLRDGSTAKFDVLKEFLDPETSEFNLGLDESEPLKEITEADIQRRINDARGRHLPGFIPYSAASESIKDFQEKWKNPAFHCLSNIHGIMSKAVEESIEARFDRFPLLVGLMKHNAIKWLEECKKETLERLKFNMSMESSHPFTLDVGSMFVGKIAYLAALQEAVRNDNDRQPSDNLDLIAAVMAYFKLSFKRFADSVAMTIVHAFIDKYPKSVYEKLLMSIIDGGYDANELIQEDNTIVVAREELFQHEKRMQEVLDDLVRFGV